MLQPVTVYRWDDVGAPQMENGKPSEIIDVLTKCLVSGYGSKSPLGWTRPFYDSAVQAAVFRNNVADGGSGGYVKFFSSNGSDANGTDVHLTHALSMTGINDFFRRGFTQAFRVNLAPAASKTDKWVIIGTAIGFYFFLSSISIPMNSGTNYNPTMYVGDFYSAISSDTSRFISVVSPLNADTTLSGASNSLDALGANSVDGGSTCLRIYDADNFDAFRPYAFRPLLPGFGLLTSSADYNAIPSTEHLLLPVLIWYAGQQMNTSPALRDRFNVNINDSTVSPLVRGVLPGLNFSLKIGYRGASWPQTRVLGGKNHWLMRTTTGSGSACSSWLNMEQWNDPFGIV